MKKILLSLLLMFISVGSYSQAINVSTTTYTVPQLVTDVLFGSGVGGAACAGTISNITWSSCNNAGIGSFTNTNPNFPLQSGVVLVTGNVTDTPGPNNSVQSNGTCGGDTQLFNYIDGLGIDPFLNSYNDATRLEFDFIPLTNAMSFDFLFASEEYGTFQCTFSDAFAFFLTNTTAGTPFQNLALIPSTTTPVSVITIRNNLYNAGCASANPLYFDKYYLLPEGLNPALAPIDFNGHTVRMTASATVVPNDVYHIKLVIADRNDNALDSAVFLGGGSFNIGQANITGASGTGFEALTDFTVANGAALCFQSCREVRAGNAPIPGVSYQWTLNGAPIPGATNYNYNICEPGTFGIEITFPSGCQQIDTMEVEFLPAMPISNPLDLTNACNPFDLTLNSPVILNGQSPTDYIVNYHNSLADAQSISNIIPNPTNYTGFNGEFIYVSIQDDASGTDCRETRVFQLFLSAAGVPTFTPVGPICAGDPLAALPLVSNNGYTGTWSPALNNTATTTYTFTPAVGQCATTQTMTIVVNPFVVPAFTQVAPICAGDPLSALPTISNNGINGAWSPAINNTTTTTYTFTPTAGQCSATQTMTITVNPSVTPTFTQVAPICAGSPLSALPTTSNNGINGVWSPALDNTTTTTYTFTPTVAQCTPTVTMTITVNPLTTPTFTQVAPICSGVTLSALPTTSNNGINGVWSPALDNTTTTTYTFTPTAGQCATTQTMTITVNPIVTPTFTQVAPICSGDALSALPTTSNNSISGAWSPALDNTTTTTYTFTPNAGQCASTQTMTITVNPSITPTFTQVAPICAGTALSALPTTSNNGVNGVWSPALNNTTTTTYTFTPAAGQCSATQTMTITVNPVQTPTFTQVAPVCNGAPLAALPTTSTNGITGTWSPAIDNTTTTTYTFTPTTGSCSNTATMTIVVYPLPSGAIVASTPSVCLNFASPTVTLSGNLGTSPYTFVYTENSGTPISITSAGNTQDINVPTTTVGPITYELISVTDANGCSQNVNQSVTITVLTAPIINTPINYELCDDDSNDGVACFDLVTVVTPQVTSDPTLIVTYHETFTDAQTGAYPQVSPYCNINNLNNQILYIRVFDPNAPQCYATTTVTLIVHPKPIAVEPTDLHECDNGDAQVGFVVFNLTDKEAEILGGINPATHTVTYYESLADAQGQVNAIGTPTSYTNTVINTQTIWVVVETTATGCVDIVELQLVVDPLPLVNQPACSAYTLCETAAAGVGFEQFNLQTKVDCIVLNQLGMSVTFYPSLLDANNNTNAISNLLYTNVIQFVQTLGIRVTNTSTGCYVVSTMDIRVDPLPVPVAPLTAYEVCDTDQNGLFEFDLNTLSAGILGANPTGNVVTYHETQTDALNGTNIINTTGLYTNILPFMQTLWVAVVNPATGCRGVIPIQLKVNQSPRMPALADLVYCDEDSNNQDASTLVNLAQQTALILAAQTVPPTSNYTVTYYTNLADAQQQVNNIIPTTTYTGTNGQTIWVVVENNTTGCFEIGEFNLIINIPLALTTPPALSLCDDDTLPNNTFTTFDLTVRDLLITQGLPGYTVTYYPSWPITPASVAIANPTAYMNVQPAVQTLGVMVTSPDGCRSYITMDIRVLPIPTPNTTNIPILAPQCEDAQGSGQQFFDITVNENYILNNDPNVTPHYFHSLADATAVPPVNEILNPTLAYIGDPTLATQTPRPVNEVQYIYIAVTSNIFTEYTGQNCYKIVEQPFIINPLPIANAIDDQQICEEDATGNDGFEVFNLPSYNNLILDGNDTTPVSTYVVSFFEDAGLTIPITNPSAYTNLTNPQTIYVSVTTTNTYVDPVTGTTHTTSCTSITDFDIIVNPKPSIAQPAAPLATCDNTDGVNDGYEIYSLASLETEILNGQDPTLFTVTFYESEYNPDATPPLTPTAIIDTVNYPAYTHTFWATVTNNATGCFKTVSFNIVVEQMPEPFITNDPALNVICVDFTSGAVVRPLTLVSENQTIPYLNEPTTPRPTYTYQWYEDNVAIPGPEGTAGPTYTINNPLNDDQSSIFTLEMTSTSALGCSSVSQDYLVIQSGQATPATGTIGYTVTNAFADNQIITVTVQGYGTYQYSLDDGPRQDSPIFEYVGIGDHIITVWDTEGGLDNSCDPLIMTQVQTIDYPLYFTPNGDGIHDNWNIVGLSGQPTAKIYIFDRHGKLIKQLSSQSPGWDGTYNGQQMPATDYWFTVDFSEQSATRQFRAHFSLKR